MTPKDQEGDQQNKESCNPAAVTGGTSDPRWLVVVPLLLTSGRISRQTFWIIWIVSGLCHFALNRVAGMIEFQGSNLFLILHLWILLAAAAKRLHDRGKSAWMLAVNLIPVFGWIWTLAQVGCLEGDLGPNRFGDDPLEPRDTGTEEAGYALLSQANRMERHARVKEALAAYGEITRKYGHTAAGRDAEISASSLRAKLGSTGAA